MKTTIDSDILIIEKLLDPNLSVDAFIGMADAYIWREKNEPLIEYMILLKKKGKEINAENLFLESKSKVVLLRYMEIVNAIDSEKLNVAQNPIHATQ